MNGRDPVNTQSLIQVAARGLGASAAQQRFQQLVAQIKGRREELQEWEDYAPRYAGRIAAEFDPVRKALREKQREMVLLIDELLSRPEQDSRLRRGDPAILRFLIMDLLEALENGEPDAALDELRLKHATAEERARMKLTATMLAEQGRKRADAPNAEERLEDAFARAERNRRDEEARRQQSRQAGPDSGSAASQVLQSLREVFRKLVSALHPDREADPTERDRKNRLMQRVNKAYEANDLLTLLGLQVEIAQIDPEQLSSSERLEQYNQALDAQLVDLDRQINAHRQVYLPMMASQGTSSMTVTTVDRELTRELAKLNEALGDLSTDLVRFRDPRQLRVCLDEQVRAQADELNLPQEEMDIDELRVLVGMHNEAGASRKQKRRDGERQGR